MTETNSLPLRVSENLRTPERSLAYTPLLGLQGRLTIGGAALNPANHAELKYALGEGHLHDNTEDLLNKASKKERSTYWNAQAEQNKNLQLTAWQNSVVTKITSLAETSFGSEHADFFKKMGMDITHFTNTDAQNLYTKYFSKEKEKEGFELFSTDVLQASGSQGTTAEKLAIIKNNLPAIEWMAGMFGKNSAELITQLIDAGIDSVVDPVAFVANRKDKVNNLSAHEKELLIFLTEGEVVPDESEKKIHPIKLDDRDYKLLNGPQFETPHITFEQNLQGAQAFCTKLRKRMVDNQKQIGHNQIKFTDPKTGITITAPNADHFEQNGMFAHQFIDWVEQNKENNFPIVILTTNLIPTINHANLLLSSPKQKNGQGPFYISYYDPYSASEQEVAMQGIEKPFVQFKVDHMKQLTERGNEYVIKNKQQNGKINEIFIPKSRLNRYLVDKWLNLHISTEGKFYAPSISEDAAQAIIDGTYDLTLNADSELPVEMKYGKMGQLQYTPSDCGPLSFYSGILRYLAKPGEQLKKLRLAKKIERDWDVSILTRNQLIGLKDPDPKVNNLYNKQFTFGTDQRPYRVVDVHSDASGKKIIVLYRETDDQVKEIPFENLEAI